MSAKLLSLRLRQRQLMLVYRLYLPVSISKSTQPILHLQLFQRVSGGNPVNLLLFRWIT
jgi:hypothetical protein